MQLTDNVELVANLASLRVTEIDAAPVESCVALADVGQQEGGHVARVELGPIAQPIIAPVFGLLQRPQSQIHTAMTPIVIIRLYTRTF